LLEEVGAPVKEESLIRSRRHYKFCGSSAADSLQEQRDAIFDSPFDCSINEGRPGDAAHR
jgi:hypothetical protein